MKFKSDIFKFSNKYIFCEFLYLFFLIFLKYIKKSRNLPAKYYQEKKERLQKKACERKKEKNNNIAKNITKIYQKVKNKGFLSVEKYYRKKNALL